MGGGVDGLSRSGWEEGVPQWRRQNGNSIEKDVHGLRACGDGVCWVGERDVPQMTNQHAEAGGNQYNEDIIDKRLSAVGLAKQQYMFGVQEDTLSVCFRSVLAQGTCS